MHCGVLECLKHFLISPDQKIQHKNKRMKINKGKYNITFPKEKFGRRKNGHEYNAPSATLQVLLQY